VMLVQIVCPYFASLARLTLQTPTWVTNHPLCQTLFGVAIAIEFGGGQLGFQHSCQLCQSSVCVL
jgi:hypothetical protein